MGKGNKVIKSIIDGVEWWEDNDGNMWHAASYTEQQARDLSDTMDGCTQCEDCEDCMNCTRCQRCTQCAACKECSDCISCGHCYNCTECENCYICLDVHEQEGTNGRVGPKDSEL